MIPWFLLQNQAWNTLLEAGLSSSQYDSTQQKTQHSSVLNEQAPDGEGTLHWKRWSMWPASLLPGWTSELAALLLPPKPLHLYPALRWTWTRPAASPWLSRPREVATGGQGLETDFLSSGPRRYSHSLGSHCGWSLSSTQPAGPLIMSKAQ